MGEALNKKAKFWLFFLLGICIYMPFFLFSIMIRFPEAAILFLGCFFVYCYFLYRFVLKKMDPKYPMMPPEGRMDIYSGANIPRPIHEDVRRYPEFFGKKKKKKYKRTRQVKKKT